MQKWFPPCQAPPLSPGKRVCLGELLGGTHSSIHPAKVLSLLNARPVFIMLIGYSFWGAIWKGKQQTQKKILMGSCNMKLEFKWLYYFKQHWVLWSSLIITKLKIIPYPWLEERSDFPVAEPSWKGWWGHVPRWRAETESKYIDFVSKPACTFSVPTPHWEIHGGCFYNKVTCD